ncbi:tRNA N(3)-methylcytidine methyltransferase METTL6 isoform X2 [Oryza brachyantha]|uniref:tRNA N(3)-methylcytidine methyltransferase METTL6 isoform X2 n=1 Tax=Oryza brachyantha TaxID=4533 RepID=UPI000776AA22|nr:tRNA N(3)-methylcytidine methyltransferase METTL6 isoform X2 [Oryza brachyantha]
MEGGGGQRGSSKHAAGEAEEYHCHDFQWEDLRAEVEANPAFSYHLSPFAPTAGTSQPPPSSDAWRSFHRRHTSGKFFKERRYLLKEFPELNSKGSENVLEVGCGNGSTVVPILRSSPGITVYACDCSKETLEKTNEIVCNTRGVDVKDRFHPFLLDVSTETFPDWLFCKSCRSSRANGLNNCNMIEKLPAFLTDDQRCVGGIDFITMIFTLSAIPLDIMPAILERCVSVLKPGGLVLFRDYGLYDMTMLRFLPHQRVGFREYMRSDGTFSYYFTLDVVRELFRASGLLELDLEYCCVSSVNRKNSKKMQRVWVHGKFQKPTAV